MMPALAKRASSRGRTPENRVPIMAPMTMKQGTESQGGISPSTMPVRWASDRHQHRADEETGRHSQAVQRVAGGCAGGQHRSQLQQRHGPGGAGAAGISKPPMPTMTGTNSVSANRRTLWITLMAARLPPVAAPSPRMKLRWPGRLKTTLR